MINDSGSMLGELRSIDLNLLVALRALLDEKHVSRAAEKAGLSQPGMSRALQRLRSMFNDPLLVKADSGYALTPRAKAADRALRQVLSDIQNIVSPPEFNPKLASGDWRISAFDYEYVVLLPTIVSRLREEAPGMRVRAIAIDGLDFSPLMRGDLHLTLTAANPVPPSLYRKRLFEETNVCIASVKHPYAGQKLDFERFMECKQVWVNVFGPDPGAIDHTLASHNLSRDLTMIVPSFSLACHIVACTELIAILPKRVVMQFVESGLVCIMDLPITFPNFTIFLYWHERHNKDPQHVWFRKLISDITLPLQET